MSSSSINQINFGASGNHIPQLILVRLDGSNYIVWRFQVENALLSHELLGYVNGTNPCPSRSMTEPYTQWVKQDHYIFSWLLSSLTKTALAQVVGSKTSKDVWETLKSLYSPRGIASFIGLRNELDALRKNDLSMTAYLQKLKVLGDKLATIGEPLTNSQLIHHVLNGISPDYDAFSIAIITRTDELSFASL
ncbi:PREDICTED: uncharacterized protein LOC104611766 [Nelumbo nucifera]|uniref:Uncharacterized protein LOC104611766 n=1 Tax=Nelumbo nucifera TaxID=4432 RepID=A0A1U8BBU3_NELNU|nr:PREDICTED: uncharacterized protein LOC104611766 [Nelumbo nucifera]